MLIYNITLKIEWTIQPQWLAWMNDVYIKQVMNTGCFISYQLVRLLDIDEDEGPTYALQLYMESRAQYIEYLGQHLPEHETLALQKWGSRALSFSTLMEVVEDNTQG